MTQKPKKGDFGELKSKTFPGGACPQSSLEVENRSVFILDPRLLRVAILDDYQIRCKPRRPPSRYIIPRWPPYRYYIGADPENSEKG